MVEAFQRVGHSAHIVEYLVANASFRQQVIQLNDFDTSSLLAMRACKVSYLSLMSVQEEAPICS